MINRPPPPELLAAKRREIRRRYSRKSKVGKRTRPMAAIRLAELTRWLAATNRGQIDATDHGETIARIFVHHFVVLSDGNRRAAQWIEHQVPWMSLRDREYLISEANRCPLKWTADKLAWKLGLRDALRTELKIRTIGAIDCNADQRKERRRLARVQANRDRRARIKAAREASI
jgi:hypothetical protein